MMLIEFTWGKKRERNGVSCYYHWISIYVEAYCHHYYPQRTLLTGLVCCKEQQQTSTVVIITCIHNGTFSMDLGLFYSYLLSQHIGTLGLCFGCSLISRKLNIDRLLFHPSVNKSISTSIESSFSSNFSCLHAKT